MKLSRTWLACGFLVALLSLLFSGEVTAADFTPMIYTAPEGKTILYEFFQPQPYDPSQKYPIVIFFHGVGECGTDNKAQLIHVVKTFIQPENQAKYPCFVIAPQCPKNQQWVDMPWGATSGVRPAEPSAAMKLALQLLAKVSSQFSIDPNRVYATGLSMGGYAVWDCVTRFPHRFAAGALACGGGDEKTINAAVAQVPVWAFHSSDDPAVPVVRDRNMIQAMKAAGGHPRYTEYQGLGHMCWGKAFSEPELLPWLFAQRLDRRGKLSETAQTSGLETR